jgi:hypothetical protein
MYPPELDAQYPSAHSVTPSPCFNSMSIQKRHPPWPNVPLISSRAPTALRHCGASGLRLSVPFQTGGPLFEREQPYDHRRASSSCPLKQCHGLWLHTLFNGKPGIQVPPALRHHFASISCTFKQRHWVWLLTPGLVSKREQPYAIVVLQCHVHASMSPVMAECVLLDLPRDPTSLAPLKPQLYGYLRRFSCQGYHAANWGLGLGKIFVTGGNTALTSGAREGWVGRCFDLDDDGSHIKSQFCGFRRNRSRSVLLFWLGC